MKNNSSRRDFLKKSAGFCFTCGTLVAFPRIPAMGLSMDEEDTPDPKKLNYCGYVCPADCPMKKATAENNVELKKECYKNWRIQEKYGVEFDPEKVVCYGCKTDKEYKGVVVENCTVRKCAIEKGYDCCIECNELAACDKEIWKAFPDFHKAVIEMQKKYQSAKA